MIGIFKRFQGCVVKKDEVYPLQTGAGPQIVEDCLNHDSGAVIHGKAPCAGPDGWKGDTLESLLLSPFEAVAHGDAERFRRGASTQPHAGGVNDIERPEIAASRHDRVSHRDRSEAIAFLLNARAAFAPDGSGDSGSQHQIRVGGVDEGVHSHLRNVALQDMDFGWHQPLAAKALRGIILGTARNRGFLAENPSTSRYLLLC